MSHLFLEQTALGIIQGIAEWLPVSSEGAIVLVKTLVFHSQSSLEQMVSEALFLHLGSVMAAIIYFRNDITRLLASLKNIRNTQDPDHPLLIFLLISTLISGVLGLALLKIVSGLIVQWPNSTKLLALLIGVCLTITGALQLMKKTSGLRVTHNLKIADGILLGIAQGFAALPGLSRSGLTVAALLFRRFGPTQALRLSFLMSIPIVLAGNIVMNLGGGEFQLAHLCGLGFSFSFSLLTIDLLLRVARKINFGVFVIVLGALIILSALLPY